MAGNKIVNFYAGTGTDNRGRRLSDIQSWQDDELEMVHDYIQWLFPLKESSAYNSQAPILDSATINEFHRKPDLRRALYSSFATMLKFYGFKAADPIARAPDFPEKARNWLHPGNHNHLRITRILKCLATLGLKEEARQFFQCLQTVRESYPQAISATTFQYWQMAIGGNDHS